MNIQIFIMPYINPDLDGISCALGMEHLFRARGEDATAVYFGRTDAQTRWALTLTGEASPLHLNECPAMARYVLVDTHHVNQLPQSLPKIHVMEIVDHHPMGNPKAFPNAKIQNEDVGAAATLVLERLVAESWPIHESLARLLGLGILSNTLSFTAPSTQARDQEAFEYLCRISTLKIDDWHSLRAAASSEAKNLSINELVFRDVKTFTSPSGLVTISQVETEDASRFNEIDEVQTALESLLSAQGASHALVNIVDLVANQSIVICNSDILADQLASVIGTKSKGRRILVKRVLLRKTDLVPVLANLSFRSIG